MGLDKEREILKDELEKTTGVVSSSSNKEPAKKVGVGIRTYSADIADIMKREKGSIIKIALAEQARQKEGKESKDPTSTRNIIIILVGASFIIFGIMIFVFTILNKDNPVSNISVSSPVVPGLVYTENQTQTDITNLTRGNLFTTISNSAIANFAENNTMVNIFLTNSSSLRNQISILVFFDKLGIDIPEVLKSSLTGQFMLGSYKTNNEGNLFLILKVKDYNESFVAMKDWEVSMANDLVRLFKIDPKSFTGDIFLQPFRERVLFNKEMRGLYDEDGRLVISYTYIDRTTIVITSHTPSVEEIIKRINSQSIR